jgi:hypothetical protein
MFSKIMVFLLIFLLVGCTGTPTVDVFEPQIHVTEFSSQSEMDEALEAELNDLEYQALQSEQLDETNQSLDTNGCPSGCDYHKVGCDIKGNISIDSGEKIYHVPGGEWYDETSISPVYGEKWFCTEQEAINNGWRRSKE